MEIYLKSNKLQKVFSSNESLRVEYGTKSACLICRWLTCFRIASNLSEISNDKPTRRHLLKQGMEKQYSIDVQHPYRLIIKVGPELTPLKPDGGIDDKMVTSVMIMEIADTHDKSWKMSKSKFSKRFPLSFQDGVSTQEILTEYIDMHKMSSAGFAKKSKITSTKVDEILAGSTKIDEETAKRLRQITNLPTKIWLGQENIHPKFVIEKEQMETIETQTDEAIQQPMLKRMLNWVKGQVAKIFKS